MKTDLRVFGILFLDKRQTFPTKIIFSFVFLVPISYSHSLFRVLLFTDNEVNSNESIRNLNFLADGYKMFQEFANMG